MLTEGHQKLRNNKLVSQINLKISYLEGQEFKSQKSPIKNFPPSEDEEDWWSLISAMSAKSRLIYQIWENKKCLTITQKWQSNFFRRKQIAHQVLFQPNFIFFESQKNKNWSSFSTFLSKNKDYSFKIKKMFFYKTLMFPV